jgi:hypothetical protein
VAVIARGEAQTLLTLKALLGEAEALILLTQTQLSDAQRSVAALIKLHGSFPGLLAHLNSTLLMLAGQWTRLPHASAGVLIECLDSTVLQLATSFVGETLPRRATKCWTLVECKACVGHYAQFLGLFSEGWISNLTPAGNTSP